MKQVFYSYAYFILASSDLAGYPTVLLITSATLELWGGKPQLSIARTTLIEVDPAIDVAKRLQGYARKLKPTLANIQLFPGDIFDWETELGNRSNIRLLYRLAEVEDFAQSHPKDQCVGYLNVMVVEMNLVSLCVNGCLPYGLFPSFCNFTDSLHGPSYKQNMLLYRNWCGKLTP